MDTNRTVRSDRQGPGKEGARLNEGSSRDVNAPQNRTEGPPRNINAPQNRIEENSRNVNVPRNRIEENSQNMNVPRNRIEENPRNTNIPLDRIEGQGRDQNMPQNRMDGHNRDTGVPQNRTDGQIQNQNMPPNRLDLVPRDVNFVPQNNTPGEMDERSDVSDSRPRTEERLSSIGGPSEPGTPPTGVHIKGRYSLKPAKNTFGSSTTLSSTTETSDDADDQFNVVLRVRPLNSQEVTRHDEMVASFPGEGRVAIDNQGTVRSFYFNAVFEKDATQEDLFEHSGITRLVDMALNGYACTALAFGQTGSGKTHTMTGPPQQMNEYLKRTAEGKHSKQFLDGLKPDPKMFGLIQRSFRYMYRQLKQMGTTKIIRASYLEIYNEQVIDLLNPSHRRYLSVRWSKNKGFYVENLFSMECETLDDLMAVLEEGLRNRQTGSHGLNEFSSRSHSMLTVTIDSETQPDQDDDNLYITKRGKLSFVDLAGSEKVKDNSTGAGAGVMYESNSINKSLLVLGNCISHLGDSKRRHGHIPYRDSKLTKLLADSLGGNGVTLMITCITPSSYNVTETMNTLRYASRAKKIKTKPTVKMDPREKLILSLKREIKILRNENHYLRQQLEFPAKPKGQLQKENDEKFMKFMKEQQQKESGLYEMLQEYMVENENLRGENSDLHATRDKVRREQQQLYRENEKLLKKVEDLERSMGGNQGSWQQQRQPMPRSMGGNQGGWQQQRQPMPRYEGFSQYDIGSPRQSPGMNGHRRTSIPNRLPPQDLPQPDPGSRVVLSPPQGQPMRPPHRLPDPIPRGQQHPIPDGMQNGGYPKGPPPPHMNGPPQHMNGPGRQVSPTRTLERKASQASQSDAIRDMNEQLLREVKELEGEIVQHQRLATRSHDITPRQYPGPSIR